ncbi:MAG: SRPBCC domain-containing protein, partial [Rhodospirillales bacterium]|nr:SRPBCC domain-containing protein [Rhodospirillales bacterium]
SEVQPPESYVLVGEGKGGAAGFAKGSARVALAESDDGGTVLSYTVEVGVGGRLAQLGSRLIGGAMDQYSTSFFNSFADIVAAEAAPAEASSRDAPAEDSVAPREQPPARGPRPRWQVPLLVALGILAVLLVLASFS